MPRLSIAWALVGLWVLFGCTDGDDGTGGQDTHVTDTALQDTAFDTTFWSDTDGEDVPTTTCDKIFVYVSDGGTPVNQVLVSGTFNGWADSIEAGATAMTPQDGFFRAVISLAPGYYEYRLIVDGTWLEDPLNPDRVLNEFSEYNSVLNWACDGRPQCGDGTCDGSESAESCSPDCPTGPACGNGTCEAGESYQSCPADCPVVCGDGSCDDPETRASCPKDCPPVCGDTLCESPETHESCPQDCPPVCGDDQCEEPETYVSCPLDCTPPCGNGHCEVQETKTSCPQDCSCEAPFSYTADGPKGQVLLTGDLTTPPWAETAATGAHVMTNTTGNTWEVAVPLDPGTYAYKFIVDGTWVHDPNNPNTVDDGFGGVNSVLEWNCGAACGNGICELGEDDVLCPADCANLGPVCSDGLCESPESPLTCPSDCQAECGNGVCEAGETAEGCPPDCGAECGNGQCEVGENAGNCPNDCEAACGNAACEPGETAQSCPVDCQPVDVKLAVNSHQTTGDNFSATVELQPATATLDATSVAVTVDWSSSEAYTTAGNTIQIDLTALSTGIHDVRVTAADGSGNQAPMILLKVYTGIVSDWKHSVLYFAMTDRFNNGDPANDNPVAGQIPALLNYQGGDFAGITDQIEQGYFEALGVNAIWISWVADNPNGAVGDVYPDTQDCGINEVAAPKGNTTYTAYHSYWPEDLYEVEDHFGTMEELRKLVNAAHSRGIKILLDFTANHVYETSDFYAQYRDQGYFNDNPIEICPDVAWAADKATTCWFTSYLPDIDYNHPGAVQAITDMAIWWIRQTGADGFRFDALKHIEMSFITTLRGRLESEIELTGIPFYMVGETFDWVDAIKKYIGDDKVHGQFDFPTNLRILEAFAKEETGLGDLHAEVRGFKAQYGNALMSNFLGNHDMARFISHAAGHIKCGLWDIGSNKAQAWYSPPADQVTDEGAHQKLRLAFAYVMTLPGIPLIYYGDEFGLPGAGDPDNRRMMRFGGLNSEEQATLQFVQQLGQARLNHPALWNGDWTAALKSESDLLLFARTSPEQKAVVALNRGSSPRSEWVDLSSVGVGDGTQLQDIISGATISVSGGGATVDIGARTAAIYVTQ